jgi:CheY-like chemotaxis protein
MSELLQGTELSARQRRLAETITRSATGLLEIINDILDFSKIEAGKLELEHIEFALREIIEETIEILVLRARAKGLELRCEIEPRVPAAVRGDPVRLRQVLINLAGNAIKFTEAGEVVVRVAALALDGSLRFEVSDTGIGIATEAQSQIFSAFTQADSFTTRKYGGTGLGLAICRQLVALMGGVIGVASEQNRGSTFWFEIRMEPVAAPAVSAVPAVRPAPARLPAAARFPAAAAMPATGLPSATGSVGPRILVVEDNAVNREVAAGMLENLGYRSEAAVNGLLALEAVAETTFGAVLMDCQMPVMDGLTATQEIRRREAGSGGRVAIIALTANAMEANRERCLAAGMDDFLPKPFTQVQLAVVLGRWAPVAHAPRHDEAVLAAGETAQAMISAATAAARDIAVIDTEVLRNIAALGRPALLGSLIDLYLEHSRPLLETIESAIRGREPAGLPEALHTLKSSSANLGGARLTELLRECESLAQERGAAALPQLARVPAAHHEFCEALIRERSALAA